MKKFTDRILSTYMTHIEDDAIAPSWIKDYDYFELFVQKHNGEFWAYINPREQDRVFLGVFKDSQQVIQLVLTLKDLQIAPLH